MPGDRPGNRLAHGPWPDQAPQLGRRRHLRTLPAASCDQVAELLPGIVDGGLRADAGTLRHVETCLRCQAELVSYRRLLRALHQLRTEVLEPSPAALAAILATLEAAGERRALRSLLADHRAAYLGGVAVATAAGAAGALVLASRGRRRRVA